eukprot:537784-Rhodomonas_salina.1
MDCCRFASIYEGICSVYAGFPGVFAVVCACLWWFLTCAGLSWGAEEEEKEENGEAVDSSMRDIISNLQLLAQKAAAVELHLTLRAPL